MTKNIFNQNDEHPRISEIHREVKSRLETAADADATMSKKAKLTERKIEALEIELPKEQGIFERMRKDCRELQEKIRAEKMKAANETEAQLRADVQSGKIGVVQFHEAMAEHQRKTKAETEGIDHEITEAIEAVRAKALEILKMENDLWTAKAEYYYCLGYPQDVSLKELSKMIQEMSFRSQAIQSHYMGARAEQEKFKDRLDRAKGQALVAGWNRDGLSLADVQALIFLPEIPKKYLESLAVIIREIEANEQKRIAGFQDPGQYYLSVSYMQGMTKPWTWLCRNDSSPALTMNKPKAASGLTMANIPTKDKLEV